MINPKQLVHEVIRPTLDSLGMHTMAAEQLVLGTGVTESKLSYIKQVRGPALGIFQMEPATHDDIWEHWIAYQPLVEQRVSLLLTSQDRHKQLISNLAYAAAMCRIHYRRIPAPLPPQDDLEGQASYWKKYYNTHLGKGTVEHYMHLAMPVLEEVYG